MHLANDNNEVNSIRKGSANFNEKLITSNPSIYGAKTVTDSERILSSTSSSSSSADSCCSSTDSGVIINDEATKRILSQTNEKNVNNKNNYNGMSVELNTASDNSGNNNNVIKDTNDNGDNEKRTPPNEDNSKSINNKNVTINNQIDKNNINIENVIHIGAESNTNMQRQRQRSQRHSTSSRTSSKNCSPTVSIRSNTISIISIDENAIDSSVVDSDSDYEGQHSDYVIKKLGQQTTYEPDHPNLLNINKGMQVLSQTISQGALPPTIGPLTETLLNGGTLPNVVAPPPMSPNAAQIGSIALSNSTDVTFGDKHFYEGPVTIQQIVIDSRNKRKNGEDGGNDNPAYSNDGSDPENNKKTKHASNQPEPPYKFIFNRRATIITGSIILLTVLAGIIIVTVNVLTKPPIRKSKILGDGDDSRKHIPIHSTIEPWDNPGGYKFNGTLLIVGRDEWFAEAEGDDVEELKLPAPRVIIAHTASTSCENKMECDARVQSVQAFHMHSFGWGDIGYNFLVGGDGLVYEGRGWYKVGAHTKGYNRDSIGIAFIGTYNEELPTDNDLLAAKLLIEEGVQLGAIAKDYKLYGARQLSGTESPGKALYSTIMKWPHWTQDNVGGGTILRIVARDAWLAQPPSATPVPLATPVKKVIVLSTLTEDCQTQAMCVYRVRMTQTLNIESQNHDDIIYNYLIGGDGNVYEGRGWDVTGAHLRGFNSDSISLAFIGTFKKQKPSDKQMNVTKLFLEEGVRLGKISPDYKIYGAYMLEPTLTETKADELYKSFENWPHWSEYGIHKNTTT